MKRWKHNKYYGPSGGIQHYEVPADEYHKIMAVYKAAVKVSNDLVIAPYMNDHEKKAIEALDKAVERAEK